MLPGNTALQAVGLTVTNGAPPRTGRFDASVGAISSRTSFQHLAKLLLAIFCFTLVVPAWSRYILPMVVRQGWRFGFLASVATKRLDWDDKATVKHFEEIRQHFWTYGRHAVVVPDLDSSSSSSDDEPEDAYHALPGSVGNSPHLSAGQRSSMLSPRPQQNGQQQVAGLPRDLAWQLYKHLKREFDPNSGGAPLVEVEPKE